MLQLAYRNADPEARSGLTPGVLRARTPGSTARVAPGSLPFVVVVLIVIEAAQASSRSLGVDGLFPARPGVDHE